MAMVERRIAVIGMACRLPGGVDGPESLWSMLAERRDGRKEVPKDRWVWTSFYNKNPDTKDATNFSHAYFLDGDVSAFDARFFNISGIDAATIDPQQRLLLEVTYEALENAGLPIENIRGSDTSVHMAMFARDYDRMGYRDMAQADMAHIIGAGEAIMANRISYVLDLKGSSNTLDTGCSGGLVALHQACQTLRADESEVALAGASQLLLTPDQSVAMSQLTNKDGRSYTFDDRGAGYARGEGLGVLVLKRLDRAVQDGDHIHAVIVESGAGHDGKTSGIFLPNGDAQEALVRSVYDRAGLDPRETLFVESHGTGTVAGDDAEVSSIARVFGREAGRTSNLPIGSIKTNIGHLEAASGIAGTIKAIMVLKKNQIPPQLNFINPKPTLRLEERGLKVPLELMPLTPEGYTGPRRVSVNSFGYGGANAHAILEAYDQSLPVNGYVNGNGHVKGSSLTTGNGHYANVQDHEHTTQQKLIVLSANSESSLSRLVSNLRQWLKSDQGQSASFADVAYTLNTRRSKLLWRCSVAASNISELEEALGNAKLRPVKSARDVALAFVFTGQGAQWFAMGRELLTDSESREFASSIAICNQIMKDLGCEWDLVEELIKDEKSSRLGEARFAQPVTTAIQIALVDLLGTTYVIRPQAVYGHSSGEIAAAYAAGALTREAAMQVALMRGICSAEAKSLNSKTGGMLAVGEGEDAVRKRIKLLSSSNGKVTVACVNSPESTTISGDVAALHELQTALGAASVFNRQLKVDSAYHSHHMEVVAPSYLSSLEGLAHGTPRQDVAFYSSVTGARKRSGFGPSYWVSNLVSQVKFSAASQLVAQHLADAYSNAANVLIEVGPHAALSGPLRQSLSESSFKLASGAAFKYDYVPCLVRKTSAVSSVLALAGKVFESGSPVQLDGGESRKSSGSSCRVVGDLPSYPWDHSNTYWRESRLSKKNRLRPFAPHDLLGIFETNSSPYEPRWRYHVSLANIPWLRDHVVEGFVIFPGAGYLIMVIEAMKQLFQLRKMPGLITNINFRDATFAKPIVIHDGDSTQAKQEVELQLVISPSRQHAASLWEHFRVVSYDSENDCWIDNCSGLVSWDSASADAGSNIAAADQFVNAQDDDGLGHFTNETADRWLRDVQALCTTSLDATETYRHLKATGNEYGDTFQGLKEIHIGKGHATATIVIQDITQQIPGHYMQPHTIHPSTFDSIFQLEPVCFQREGRQAPIMPSMLGQISVAVDMESAPGTEILVALQHFQRSPRDAAFAYCAYQKRGDGSFRPVVTGTDIRTQVVGEADTDTAVQKKMTYRMEWNVDVDYLTQSYLAGHDTYHDHVFDTRIAAYVQAVVHQNPNMKILALGAGDGGISVPLLEAIGHNGRLPVDSYIHTEESLDLLERAQNSLDRWVDQIDFKTLDITSDPLLQGHAASNFDLAIASMAWIALPQVDAIMAHIRKLLKPGGRLMLLKPTAASAARKEVSDILDNLRASGVEHQDASSMNVSDWNLYLKRNGFSSTELALSAGNNLSSGASSMIVAKALTAAETANGHPQGIEERSLMANVHLGHSKDASQVVFGDALCRSLEGQGIKCSRESWSTKPTDAKDPTSDDISIVVDSAEYPVLLDPSAETFDHVKRLLLLQGGNVLWVSFQTSPPFGSKSALKHMINGTARVLRRENPDLRLITVDIQDPIQRGSNGDNLQSVIQMVTDVTKRSFWSPSGVKYKDFRPEHEYAICNGKLMIPRVVPDDDLATHIDSRNNAEQNKTADAPLMNCLYLNKDRPIKFDVQVPGLLKTIRFVDNDDMSGPLDPDEVQIEAHAHGVSFKDVSITLGHMAPGTPMSGEVAGVIVGVGSNVQSWKVGDRVAALSVAQFGNQVRVNSKNVVAIPDSLTFTDAASIPLSFLAAWYCLHQVARIEKGQSVLIHSGSGGVGQSAIQLAQLAGAEIFVTAGSIEKKRLIEEQYGIPASQIFSSHSSKFKKQILDATRGNGVDVVLNSLPGQLLRDSWDCLAPFGTFCEIGKTDILGRGQLSMAKFDKQATFAAVDALYMQLMRPERAIHGIERIFSMVDGGLLKPVYPITTFDMSHIEQAFSLMAERKHMGKLVLVANEQTRVQATKPKAPVLRLRQDGTYVIGGGLGDLGKRMGQFLAEKGAGHIVALTRRDVEAVAKQPAVMEVRESIKKLGGTLHVVQCDICDSGSARGAADMFALLGLPPVRGIIQSATVLRDHPLEFMELNDWQESVRPKVHGTLTMDEAFCSPETTEFFVMLSSVASIVGSASQSNYAAGNAFLDAFAQSRKHSPRGITNYATINVGAVEGSKLVGGALQQGSHVTRSIGSVSFNDVLAALEYAISPEARVRKDVVQHLMHFDRDAMEDAFGPSALSDRIYDHVPSKRGREANASATDGKKKSILQTVEQVDTIAEAEDIVKQALLGKFTAFLGDEVPDVPIAALGLDSLVSIELKNWVKHTFRTPLQISELSGAQSMIALAKVIVSRMTLKLNNVNGTGPDDDDQIKLTGAPTESETDSHPTSTAAADKTEDATSKPTVHGQNCCKLHRDLPVQPLPDLDDSLDFWLEANEHLFRSQQLESIHHDIQAMRAPDSTARQILRHLYDSHGHDETNGWFADIVTDARFLCRRSSIAPWTSIMGAQRDNSGKRHSQVERASIITSAALSYRRAMDAGEVEPLEIAGRPECTWGWKWLFNSTRVPQLECDKMVSYAQFSDDEKIQDHVAVLRKGRVFKVAVQDDHGQDVSFEQLQATFEAIVARDETDTNIFPGLLTTDDRDSWAKIRETLVELSPRNAEYFHVLDSAMFLLCLDAGHPESPDQIARQGYIGDGTNRWFDKVLQFYVSANGRSGLITEHGILDGTTATRLLEWIAIAMESHPAGSNSRNRRTNGNHVPSEIQLNGVTLEMTPEVEGHALTLGKIYQQATSASTYVREQLDEFGTDFLLQSRVPVKGVIDLTFQLAVRLFFGQNMPSWEPTSGALFHAGRADALQRATPAVNAFCDAAATVYHDQNDQKNQEDSGTSAQLRALLLAATKSTNAGMQTLLLTGRGSQRVFEVLSYLWPRSSNMYAPKPAFLSDMVFFGRPSPPIFAQTNSLEGEMIVEDFVHLMQDTDGFWSFICPEKNTISVSLTGGSPERTAAFVKELHRAARIIRDITGRN